jgi:hypothetical protein
MGNAITKLNVLLGCECSGAVRREFRKLGHNAWSCDLKPAEDGSPYHIQGDIRYQLDGYYPGHGRSPEPWNLFIVHPDCTYMANSGVQWLHTDPGRWEKLDQACDFFLEMWNAPIDHIGVENPVMHGHAKKRIGMEQAQTIQPWWFGDEAFKATCLWLKGLPPLFETNRLTPPKKGTPEHKKWSAVHREAPGPNRKANRSRTYPGIAAAMAEQWSRAILAEPGLFGSAA